MPKFDKDAFKRALNATLVERLPHLVRPGDAGLFVYTGQRPLQAIARGIAGAFSGPVRIVELASDRLEPDDNWTLLEPLLTGQTLVLVHSGESGIPGRLAAYWPKFAENPNGYVAAVTRDLVFSNRLQLERSGALVVVQVTNALDQDILGWPLVEEDAAVLEKAGSQLDTPIAVIGMPRRDWGERSGTKDLRADVAGRTPYERAYRLYRRAVNHFAGFTSDGPAAAALADAILRTRDEQQIFFQAQYHNLLPALEEVWASVRPIRSITLDLHGGRHDDEPLPDVYAAALSMRIGGDWYCDRERSLYRGQRNSLWRVVPSLYRPGLDGAAPDIDACLKRVGAFSHTLKSVYATLSEDQCMAVAQHFGKEASTKTPLIDVTWDPFVALFFASDGGADNDLGVVDHLVIPEWQQLVAAMPHEPGYIHVIEVPGVDRIVRQRALFLATPDPEAYARVVPYRIWFRQHAGLVFEDEEYQQPISARSLYPIDDSMQVVLDRFAAEPSPDNAPAIQAPQTNQVFGPDYLLERARQMMPALTKWDSFNMTVLKTCAELFARGRGWSNEETTYSLHRWEECLEVIDWRDKSGERCPVKEALTYTLSRFHDREKAAEVLQIARAIWQRLYNVPPSTVVEHMGEIVELTRDSRMIAAVCFAGSESHVGEVLAELSKDTRWTLVDLTKVREEDIMLVLKRVPQPAVMLIAMDETTQLSTPVRLLFKTAMDGLSRLDVGGQSLLLHRGTKPYLITWGRSFEVQNEAKYLMDVWDEIDEFDG